MLTDYNGFEQRVRAGMNFGRKKNSIDQKIKFLENNFITEELFEAMICGGNSYKTAPVYWMWDVLVKRRIFFRSLVGDSGLLVTHGMDTPVIGALISSQVFQNIFFKPSFLAERYREAVVAIDVEKNGQAYRGSGFLVQTENPKRVWMVTCRHNVDPDQGIRIERISSRNFTFPDTVRFEMHKDLDLAVARIYFDASESLFRLFGSFDVFDSVYTLGYPNVPGATADLIGHRGELNGIAHLYLQKHDALIISNQVSPGSSGCPVLRDDGLCIGMTINWLEGEWEGEKARFAAALPATLIGTQFDALNNS
jgi:Trypsin-like peptidase domain